jgi:hypothetical protein
MSHHEENRHNAFFPDMADPEWVEDLLTVFRQRRALMREMNGGKGRGLEIVGQDEEAVAWVREVLTRKMMLKAGLITLLRKLDIPLPPETPITQLWDLQAAFYAGAEYVLSTALLLVKSGLARNSEDAIPEEEDRQMQQAYADLGALKLELEAYKMEFEARHGSADVAQGRA